MTQNDISMFYFFRLKRYEVLRFFKIYISSQTNMHATIEMQFVGQGNFPETGLKFLTYHNEKY